MVNTNNHPSPLLKLPNTFRAFYGAFTGLHKVQNQAIDPILNGEDLIIQSATGTGKSEAALAPCLEQVILSHRKISILYIIPTKALAMDLKRRFESIIKERLELKFAIRTGDIKNSLTTTPDIMFTTPESLDVMLGSSNADIKGFLARIKTIIIDEAHQLVHQYRGCHLSFLFARLERRTGCKLQKIAMSATIAHKDQIIECFGFDKLSQHIVDSVERKMVARLIHIRNEDRELPALINDLYETWHYKKILIFANSRGTCDRIFSILKQVGSFKGVSQLHYSNLKPLERKEAEKRFRKDSHALCVATSTLELGIDVGDVDAVILYEPPGSVSSFIQRAGRANRRENKINVWGVCRGELAKIQVIRFLALLELSNKGKNEIPRHKTLPSVLSQQIISCLYEKKQLSVKSMESLFPEYANILSIIFSSLEKKKWLSATNIPGLFKGGWQYREHLFDYKIWGDFPETQEEYILEVSDKPIADIPKSIVGQMEVGDIVFIAGKRLEILKIDHKTPKKVLAKPGTKKDEKQLAWIGMGALVSFEVAQAMKNIYNPPKIQNGQIKTWPIKNSESLFRRTKKLVESSLSLYEKKIVLQNKIEIISSPKASYQYLTFLGAVGNLILEWEIRDRIFDDDLFVSSNETGLECSRWIKFEELNLPVNHETLQAWVKKHFKVLSSIFALNLFCKTLPKALVIQELTDFLYDPRVMDFFKYCLTHTSKIVSGDIGDILITEQEREIQEPELIDISPASPLLKKLKDKVLLQPDKKPGKKDHHKPHEASKIFFPALHALYKKEYTLTATMISDYFFHGQCKKRFLFNFFQLEPPVSDNTILTKTTLKSDQSKIEIMKKGVEHEAHVLDTLKKQGQNIIFMETEGSFNARFKFFLNTLRTVIKKMMADNNDIQKPVFLSQCPLKNHVLTHDKFKISPVGIPDLLVLSKTPPDKNKSKPIRIIMETGDIKSSLAPRYHQKWQVAFYALLLKNIITNHELPIELANTGFILTLSHDSAYKRDRFNLKPYLTAFPMMFKTFYSFLSNHKQKTMGRLQPHCVSCDLFFHCYHDALEHEDIQFLPGLSQGELLKLRQLGWNSIGKTFKELEKISPLFNMNSLNRNQTENHALSSEQAVKLFGQCRAFKDNRIYLNKKITRLYPDNISYIIFSHALKNPITGLLEAVGWKIVDKNLSTINCQIHLIDTPQDSEKIWNKFSAQISNIHQAGIQKKSLPHIFHFGSKTKNTILEWGEFHKKEGLDFLRQTQPSPWTDLKKIYMNHFHMPVPGIVSLASLAHVFKCKTFIDQPKTFFHPSEKKSGFTTDLESSIQSNLAIMDELYQKVELYLESQWTQTCEPIKEKNRGELPLYLRFINEEQRLQQDNILALQELSLRQRVAQFRAIGHLSFLQTRLDDEGRFLYILKSSEPIISKFRKGDFLRLTPHGIKNLQDGFPIILVEHDTKAQEISIRARSKKMHLNRQVLYSLEEDTSQWNQAKLIHAAKFCFSKDIHPLQNFLAGQAIGRQTGESISWVKHWLDTQMEGTKIKHQLNASQISALLLPFKYKNSMIQGPPGTGKTHLLGWILIALIMQAKQSNKPLRIGVTALTHQAINTVLEKVITLANQYIPGNFPCRCIKWGESEQPGKTYDKDSTEDIVTLEFSNTPDDILSPSIVIVGATGYGFYNLFNSKNNQFPQALDWVIFDEASQVPVPQALLSLVYSKGNFLFLGDVNQLPPIVHGKYEDQKNQKTLNLDKSILANFKEIYPKTLQADLNISYRMNKEICEFPSKTWYENKLYPAQEIADKKLCLIKSENQALTPMELKYDTLLNPARPVVLVLTDTWGCSTRSETEANLMAGLAHRLMTVYKIKPGHIALISPHRAQNNEIIRKLEKLFIGDNYSTGLDLPVIDTIERIQGAQRDIIIFGLTSSDPDHILTDFLNNPNRLNVAITRAKTKLIMIGSKSFFHAIPDSEDMLIKNYCFKALYDHCKKTNSIYDYDIE